MCRIDDTGLTGLEGAIILIAFVLIASVFSFTILGTGFFATDTAEDVIYTGVDQSVSSLMLIGDVYGYKTSGRSAVDMLRFTVRPSAGGGKAMDLSGCSLAYVTSESILTLQPNSTLISAIPPLPGMWTIYDITSDGDTPVIQFNEQVTIMVRVPESYAALPGERITVTLIPPAGTAVTVSRTVPAKVSDVTVLV
ncbi:archaellin/type IV pilin N-terminal domain-containing protein [Methanogenium sp. MK-MG]|uniref:archaellin/type IV pilin N-terminal domain-containing protein n=1 Tax=Methanogenium sp. MK-MG TaxID=2599926 RepID=UPI0013EA18FB|nr:archaellin/type IV pilin N-terminal domain-containing protein [Methanogenium sp. MK-MG]